MTLEMDPRLIANLDRSRKIIHACVHAFHDLILGFSTQITVVKVDEIVVLMPVRGGLLVSTFQVVWYRHPATMRHCDSRSSRAAFSN